MPIHDWTRVHAGTFHTFHTSWITELLRALNNGILPDEYYAMSEQVAGETGPDVLTLHTPARGGDGGASTPSGGTAVADAPPAVSFTALLDEEEVYTRNRRSLVIRHVSGDRVVAYVEPVAVGMELPPMPLFLDEDRYVSVPLESTYREAYATVPRRWREVIEAVR